MKKWPKKEGALSLTILTVIPLLLLVVAFTWESTGVNLPNLLIPHLQWWGEKSYVSDTPFVHSWQVDLAMGGTDIHVVWREGSGTNAYIHFKNKAKEDTNWPSAVDDLTQATARRCGDPAIAVVDNETNDHIHVVWEDTATGYSDILYRKSLNGGSTWDNSLGSAPDSITSDAYNAGAPDIAITSTIPHVVWHGDPDEDASVYKKTIYYSQDPDGDGLNWTDPYTVSTSSANENEFPAIAIDDHNRIHVTWHDLDEGIQYRGLTDGTWSLTITDLSEGNSTYPDIAAKGDDVYVVWNTEVAANQYQVWCRRSGDGGSTWQSSSLIATVSTALIGGYPTPRVSIDISDTVHVAWHALGTTDNQEIWHSQSKDSGVHWSSPVNVSNNPEAQSQLASIGTDSEGDAHVAWQEEVSGLWWDIFHSRTGVAGAGGGIYLPIIMKNSY